MSYPGHYASSLEDPEAFWLAEAAKLAWFEAPSQALSKHASGEQRWFADGELNLSYLALDAHVADGRGEQTALIYDSPVTQVQQKFSYRELLEQVANFAGVLRAQGIRKGDRVVIYMPMIPQAAIAMLACARLGAVHSVVFGGFAAHELAIRIDDAKPAIVVTASCGIEVSKILAYKPLVDAAIEQANYKPRTVIVYQRDIKPAELDKAYDLNWQQEMEGAEPADCVAMAGTDPLYVLYTSGTTGKPKGVVRDSGGYAVALNYSMRVVYGLKPGDVMFTASDVGWVVGHSYIVYGPLIYGATSVLYEGKPVKTPDAGAFWRVCEEHKVTALFAAPTAFRALKKEDPKGEMVKRHNLTSLKRIFMAGERLDPPTYEWTRQVTGKPVFDHWWQTETGWAVCANPVGITEYPVKPGSATLPLAGYDIRILRANGSEADVGEQGDIAIKLPLPPGCLYTIWGNHERFQQGYFNEHPGYYTSGDGGYKDDDGYVFIMGRTDDVINVAGHRLSTGEMEEVIAQHRAVAECAVIGIADELKGQVPVALVITRDDNTVGEQQLQQELVELVRSDIGAVASLKVVHLVSRLPKTRSGKILRKLLRQIADADETGGDISIPSTIDDPACVEELKQVLQQRPLSA
ncbi:propionyl-CoA synthetase [Pseudidiomarina planktonica]|uniref:Propionyl-CoA synthetase n=1 Tax=Pseudidiomarina planktonica TaxID=1323738 RepID=A0A1Y6EJK7_9GAMM|nr:acetate--CoA ligase [Pseudidiomarina planktonica]RUO65784.1 acetate--CoA ligase [Pseudidiomarina planktonica]SMQ62818.1 propionyl-CoA synthetase [Pseudidiomarina planktonica]